jgi:hypothetical protein
MARIEWATLCDLAFFDRLAGEGSPFNDLPLGTANSGTTISAGNPRVVQLALKVIF